MSQNTAAESASQAGTTLPEESAPLSAVTQEAPWWTRIPPPMAFTVAAFLGVGQADQLLHQFQQSGTRSYGISALGGGWPPVPGDAADAVALWNGDKSATAREAAVFLIGYTLLDVILIVCVVWLLSAVARRIARAYPADMPLDLIHKWNKRPVWAEQGTFLKRLRPLGYFALFDLSEDVLRLLGYFTGGGTTYYVLAFVMEKAKFLALFIVLLALVAGVRTVRAHNTEWGRLGPDRRRALVVLRGQLGLVMVFAGLLLVDVTGQIGDLFRRWTDAPGNGPWGFGSVVLLAATLWISARRTWASKTRGQLDVPLRHIFMALGITAVTPGLVLFLWPSAASEVSWALSLVILLVLVLEALARIIRWRDPTSAHSVATAATADARNERADPERAALQGVGTFVASLPVVVVGIVLVKSAVGPLILAVASVVGDAVGTYSGGPAVALLGLGLGVICLGAWGIPRIVRAMDDRITRAAQWRVHLMVSTVVVVSVAVIVKQPIDVPVEVGSLTVVAVAFSLLSLLFAELQRFSEMRVPPLGLTLLGFTRTPVFLLLAVWLVIAATFPSISGQHDIRHHPVEQDIESTSDATGEDPALTASAPLDVPLVEVWENWLAQNCVRSSQKPVPMVFVIAQGGGIRAAYWTGSVLTTLLDTDATTPLRNGISPCKSATAQSRLFAVSSISGGSVGAAAFLSQDHPSNTWYEEALGAPDYAAVALARGLFVDMPRSLVGFDADDRAALLEQAWEKQIPALAQDYFTHMRPGPRGSPEDKRWMPVTMLNSAQSETGCQVNTSAVRLTAPATSLEETGDCRAVVHRYRTLRIAVPDDPQTPEIDATYTRVPAAAVTVDTVDIMGAGSCQKSFATSTAALMSARWPYISPSGRLPCGPPWVSTIDGGYADPAGYAGFQALWNQVSPLIARHNASEESEGWVVPVLVVVDNHYQSSAKATEPSRVPQLLVPPLSAQRAGKTKGPGREQTAISMVALSPPGLAVDCIVPAYDPDGAKTGEPQLGRVLLAPTTRPGLPAPLAWTLAGSSRQDLDAQRDELFGAGGAGASLRDLLRGDEAAAITCASPPTQ